MKPTRLIALLTSVLLILASCSEKSEEGEYSGWRQRNDHFIDSIANVCSQNSDGKWLRLRAYIYGDVISGTDDDPSHYVYVHRLFDGSGDYSPLNNDSVRVHYLGRLIPSDSYADGYCFGRSYYGYTLDTATDVPLLLSVNGTIVGFKTALMHMVLGDRWRVYIPYELGYGSQEQSTSGIPAYSTLIYDMELARIYRYKIDTDTSW